MFMMHFIHNDFIYILWPLLRSSSGRCYYYKTTKVQMWLALSPSFHNNKNYNFS
jgi:hypothetical protein